MIEVKDSVLRAAEALLPEQESFLPTRGATPMVVCGYTSEFLEGVLLPVIESANGRTAEVIYPVAA